MTDNLIKALEQAAETDKNLVGEYMRIANEWYELGDIEGFEFWKARMRERWTERRKVDQELKRLKGEA